MSLDQITLGTIVIFDMGTFPNIGMVTDIYTVQGIRKIAIMHPSGNRMRERSLDYDYEHQLLAPLLGEYNTCLSCAAWDEWIANGKKPYRGNIRNT